MKKTEYICNLCGNSTKSLDEALGMLVGVHFLSGRTWGTGPIDDCNTHVCKFCIDTIRKLDEKYVGLK